ncbi:hypothetical protein EEZ25_21855 [Micromonospora aurantiaca]|uniref:hypothetical protein n=1 Tax=Micromonospora aurantiaca (nom. illeg.) TaxID=47850 RepID=UPI000F3EB535|nr:hypothetical protein [Micromonospora aurantiaca]RNH99647.1 hypothetical protein EEZ25_21855 [Micromonospora aurantiaca]
MEEVVKRWWNGSWGRLTRRDVWLVRESRWTVVARAGDTDTGKVLRWTYDKRDDASAMIERLLRADTAGQWREQQSSSTQPADSQGGVGRHGSSGHT